MCKYARATELMWVVHVPQNLLLVRTVYSLPLKSSKLALFKMLLLDCIAPLLSDISRHRWHSTVIKETLRLGNIYMCVDIYLIDNIDRLFFIPM